MQGNAMPAAQASAAAAQASSDIGGLQTNIFDGMAPISNTFAPTAPEATSKPNEPLPQATF